MVRRTETIRLLGGALCLDFANSVDWDEHGAPRPPATEVLEDDAALVAWGRRLGVLNRRGTVAVPDRELEAARAARGATRAVFAAVAAGRRPNSDALAALQATYAEATARGTLARRGDAWALTWPRNDVRSVRYATASNAVALLADPERLGRVSLCPGHNCGWLFIDASGRRKWCSMDVCGSRAKMRRLYRRRRLHENRDVVQAS